MSAVTGCTTSWSRRVSDYHDGGLPQEDRAEVEEHIRGCVACQAQIASYDRFYRRLRSLPGFEGMLTITKPGTRRGRGAAQRSTFTWPGSTASGTGQRGGGLSNYIVTLFMVVLLALAVVAGHGALGRILPSGPPSLRGVATSGPTATPIPPLPALTPNGTTCANVGAQSPPTYVYLAKDNTVYFVTNCNNPIHLGSLPAGVMSLGGWSPDGKLIAAIGQPKGSTHRMLYTLDGTSGAVHQMSIDSGSTGASASVDAALWTSATTMIVSLQGSLSTVDIRTQTVTPMNVAQVTHMVWRGSLLYYSVVTQGKVALHSRDLTAGTDIVVMTLDICGDVQGCPNSSAWDISADGMHVVYATTPSAQNPAQVMYQWLNGGQSAVTLWTMPASVGISSVAFSPGGSKVAVAGASSQGQSSGLTVVSTSGGKLLSVDKVSAFTWRYDGQAIVYEQTAASGALTPHIALLDGSGQHEYTLPAGTLDYVWPQS
jgi:hypothetical protein